MQLVCASFVLLDYLASSQPNDWIDSWQKILRQGRPLLLVVDYAEHRARKLDPLLNAAEAYADTNPSLHLRILLLARSYNWWSDCCRDSTATALLNSPATSGPHLLPDIPLTGNERTEAYQSALKNYALHLNMKEPTNVFIPPLTLDHYARPLYIHLAALAALDNQRLTTATALINAQLDREWSYWSETIGNLIPCKYDEWADSVAWLSLTGGASRSDAEKHLVALKIPGALALVAGLAKMYPDELSVGILQPDLLGEALLEKRLTGKRGKDLLLNALIFAPENSMATIGRLCADVRRANSLANLVYTSTLPTILADQFLYIGQLMIDTADCSEPGLGSVLARAWKLIPKQTAIKIAK